MGPRHLTCPPVSRGLQPPRWRSAASPVRASANPVVPSPHLARPGRSSSNNRYSFAPGSRAHRECISSRSQPLVSLRPLLYSYFHSSLSIVGGACVSARLHLSSTLLPPTGAARLQSLQRAPRPFCFSLPCPTSLVASSVCCFFTRSILTKAVMANSLRPRLRTGICCLYSPGELSPS